MDPLWTRVVSVADDDGVVFVVVPARAIAAPSCCIAPVPVSPKLGAVGSVGVYAVAGSSGPEDRSRLLRVLSTDGTGEAAAALTWARLILGTLR